ncbi:MAG: ATP-binding protein [Bacteroidota bacterium]
MDDINIEVPGKSPFESENLIRSITDSAQDAILMMDSKGRISYWNPAATRIFGFEREEAIGKNLHSLIVPQRYLQAHLDAFPGFLTSGQGGAIGKTLDVEAITKGGAEKLVQLSISSIKIHGQWNALGIIRDITEQKKTEAALILAKQDAEMANKFKSIFLANMSHEIRTPLNAIIGFSQLINRDKLLSDTQKEYNVSIIRAGEHLLTLLNDILELSKIEAGHVVINPSDVDIFSLLDDIQMIFKERAQIKNLKLIIERSTELPQYIYIDESKLRQILINIIGNAIKFTEEGSVVIRSRIDAGVNRKDSLVIEIQDSGPGIPLNEIAKLFKQFEQTSSGINAGSGTGLGLALSRELAVLMGGNISVTSQPGKGSVFVVNLEIEKGSTLSAGMDSQKKVLHIENDGKTYRILVADDNHENLKVVTTLLRIVGFEVDEALDGVEVITKFESSSPDLILMDMRMPVVDGYEACRRIKSTDKGKLTPIVALTASTFDSELKTIDSLGIQGFVRKPFREHELFNIIGKILDLKYIYDDDLYMTQSKYRNDIKLLGQDVLKLPRRLLFKMQQALSVADLDLLVELIKRIEKDNSELAQQLNYLAVNYDYKQLQKILNSKE